MSEQPRNLMILGLAIWIIVGLFIIGYGNGGLWSVITAIVLMLQFGWMLHLIQMEVNYEDEEGKADS